MTNPSPTPNPPPAAPRPARRIFRRRPPPTAEQLSDRRIRKWAELVETLILTVATLATAWAGYQASQWGNAASTLEVRSIGLLVDASRESGRAQQLELLDISLFGAWVEATAAGNARLAGFYRERLRDEFRPAFDAWLATRPLDNPDARGSPFEMAEYRLAARDRADEWQAEAERTLRTADVADSYGDRYTLLTVILAGSLLLAGLGNRFEWAELRAVVVSTALLILLISIGNLFWLPNM